MTKLKLKHPIAVGALIGAVSIAAILSGLTALTSPSPKTWDWLEDTYWYVRPQGLPNMVYDAVTDTAQPSIGQTVYHIRQCRYGYFVGECTVQIMGNDQIQCRQMIGTVTPEGQVLLTFLAMDGEKVQLSINAIGVMRRERGEWTMENQMASPGPDDPTTFVAHWAYMFQVDESDPHWNSLPFARVSVPDFLGRCER